MNVKTLPDGRQVASDSEEWRFHCEAVTLLKMPVNDRKRHLNAVEARRGLPARQALQNALFDLWVSKQAKQLAGLNDRARMERLQELSADNRPHVIDKIQREMVKAMDTQAGLF